MKFESLFKELVGLPLAYICTGHGGSLRIGFGKLVAGEGAPDWEKRSEWNLSTDSAAWRISRENRTLFGSYNQSEPLSLPKEIYSVLKEVSMSSPRDFCLGLSSGITIEFFSQDHGLHELDMLSIFCADGVCVCLSSRGEWSIWKNEEGKDSPEVSLDEQRLAKLASEANNKWKFLDLETPTEHSCRNCIAFREFSGPNYFWDYGACSHPNSEREGKVVHFRFGCKEFEPYNS